MTSNRLGRFSRTPSPCTPVEGAEWEGRFSSRNSINLNGDQDAWMLPDMAGGGEGGFSHLRRSSPRGWMARRSNNPNATTSPEGPGPYPARMDVCL